MNWFANWLDDRTGYRKVLQEALDESVPGGARWRYVWGSTLVFTFFVQMLTGIALWSAYSPSAQTAWESVYFIQHEMTLGSIVRGVHHFTAQAMVVLLAIHLMQVIIDGAYRAPREINFWLGLILAQIVLALSLTGYLLPWDQKGYYATQVTTNIVGATPFVGQKLQELAQGGTQYGHHTLTRFFAMHAGVLPGLLVGFLALHIYVFRRHGLTVAKGGRTATAKFWPDQILRDAVACLGVLSVVLLLAIFKGAELGAPANPAEVYSAARPEWYFLSLFRFLRFEAVEHYGLAFGAIYVPGAILGVITLMPLIAMIRGGHVLNVMFMWLLAAAVVGLTGLAWYEDRTDSEFQAALKEAHRDGDRVVELAQGPTKIPVTGAGTLLAEDPYTQGPRIFAKHCSSCHRFDNHNGRGVKVVTRNPETGAANPTPATAPDLGKFGTRDWWHAILTDFENHFASTSGSDYDLETSASEGMVSWFRESQEVINNPANKDDVAAMVEFLVAQSQRPDLEIDEAKYGRGEEILSSGELTDGSITTCDSCHGGVGGDFELGTDNGGIPELQGYGSKAWLTAFINHPGDPQFYGDNNHMPRFSDKLSPHELELLVRFLIRDYQPSSHEASHHKTPATASTANEKSSPDASE